MRVMPSLLLKSFLKCISCIDFLEDKARDTELGYRAFEFKSYRLVSVSSHSRQIRTDFNPAYTPTLVTAILLLTAMVCYRE
jgi:hypothetical protein